MTPGRQKMYNIICHAVDAAVDGPLAELEGGGISIETAVSLKLMMKEYLTTDRSSVILATMLFDMGCSAIAVATIGVRTTESEVGADEIWSAFKSRLDHYEALSKLKGDKQHEVQHQEERRVPRRDRKTTGGGDA